MSLLSYLELNELVVNNVITNVYADQINSTSIDITLGRYLLIERNHPLYGQNFNVSLAERQALNMLQIDLDECGQYTLNPNEFILAQSEQIFNLPNNISAEYKLKSSMARIGLEHMNAGWCDAGWNGSVLTLELKNMTRNHSIVIKKGDRIGQVVFFKHTPVSYENSYAARGRYNGDKTVKGIKI